MKKLKYYWLFILGKLRQHFFMQYPESEHDWAISRVGYLITTGAANAIAGLMGGTFIASLLRQLGMSDALNGVFSTIPTIAAISCIFMLEITKHIKKAKLPSIVSCFIARAIYGVMVFVPFIDMPGGLRTAVFLGLYIIASLLLQFVSPCSGAWLISLLPATSKGRFISIRDTVNMICAGAASLVGAGVLDRFSADGNEKTGFAVIGIMIFILTIVDTIGLNMCKEPKIGTLYMDENHEAVGRLARRSSNNEKPASLIKLVADTFKNPGFRKIICIYILWYISYYVAMPFLYIYQISELGLKYTFINAMLLIARVICALILPRIGRLADKISYMFVLKLGTLLTGLGYLAGAFCMPGGLVLVTFSIHQIIVTIGTGVHSMGMSAVLYSVFPSDGRDNSNYFAVYTTINSIIGVLCTFGAGIVMDILQKNNISLFGTHIYAQQVLCALGTLGIVATLFYLNKGCKVLEKGNGEN
ncbi:MAG: MFS transporter [Ruminococcaceae bacterium]|nr:MFS transporter [Oscillospiraceae bacterium]